MCKKLRVRLEVSLIFRVAGLRMLLLFLEFTSACIVIIKELPFIGHARHLSTSGREYYPCFTDV